MTTDMADYPNQIKMSNVPNPRNQAEYSMQVEPSGPRPSSRGGPVAARLMLDGVSVLYKAPAPPLINPTHDIIHFNDDDIGAFIEKVKGSSPMRRSDTSSASLPFSWFSSRDSLDCQGPEPISLQSEDYAPQIMTEDYVASPVTSPDYSTASSSAFYTTFLPDRDLNSSEVGVLSLDEVEIVENEYTILESSSEQSENDYESVLGDPVLRAWKSNSGLADVKAFWETKGSSPNVKYASDSNICENSTTLENGLRNIPKDKEFSSCDDSLSSSEPSGFEDHIYARIDEVVQVARYPTSGFEESGFFSYDHHRYYDNVIPEEPSDFEEETEKEETEEDGVEDFKAAEVEPWTEPRHINLISVTQNHDYSSTSESGDRTEAQPRAQKHVTLITIDSNPTNQTNPRDLGYSREPQRFGSVKDLARAFEIGPLSTGSGPLKPGPGPLKPGSGPLKPGSGPLKPGSGPLSPGPRTDQPMVIECRLFMLASAIIYACCRVV